ncbi:protein 7 [Cystoisospora suis]|uniref:Protein 7 n=1 Tax=Cystoisospora suis TaxID=483139 RepID=A0A2C6KP05_9APIC|nr:protein 7 [Cystoisospora suis]
MKRLLVFIHEELNIAHRDVKPNNLLMAENGRVQIGDMGTAEKMDQHGRVRHTKGTYMFMAPECMQVTPSCSSASHGLDACSNTEKTGGSSSSAYEGHDGRSADVWALGITLYVMLLGDLPLKSTHSLEKLFEELALGEIHIPSDSRLISEEGQCVLRGLLERNVSRRLTLQQLLEHPWIRAIEEKGRGDAAYEYARRVLLEEQKTSTSSFSDDKQIERN